MSPPRTIQLATTILEHTTRIEAYLAEAGLPGPSLFPGTQPKLPLSPEMEDSMTATLVAMDELNAMLLGPMGWLITQIAHAYDMASLHALYRFDIPSLVPTHGSIPLTDLTAMVPTASRDALARLIDHAVGNHLLISPRPGHIAHGAVSAMLASAPGLRDWVGSACEDMWPAAPYVVPALIRLTGNPTRNEEGEGEGKREGKRKGEEEEEEEPYGHTAHNMAEGTKVPFFTTLGRDPERMSRFASAMGIMKDMPGFQPAAALEAYDWDKLGGNATVVDVGGSRGDFAVALTQRYTNLSVVVQDLPDVVREGRTLLQGQPLKSGLAITFQEHDFFQPQPLKNADAYFLRMILHDWPDEACRRILRGLIPALKPGARILLNDRCVPSTEELSCYEIRQTRCQDIAMLAMFNSKERSEAEWRDLVASADSRFRFESIVRLMPSPLAVMEIIWDSQ